MRVVAGLLLLLTVMLSVGIACGPAPSSTLRFRTPQALSACAQPPADVQARLWISGSAAPCPLEVDVDEGTTSGACDAAPGIERRFTVDWFLDVGGREIVLAQSQQDVDLSAGSDVTLALSDEDVVVADCKDMSVDSFAGAESVDVDGVQRPVCDLDADGDDNLAEVCSGGEPLGGAG